MVTHSRHDLRYAVAIALGALLWGACEKPQFPDGQANSPALSPKAQLKLADILPKPQLPEAKGPTSESPMHDPDPRAQRYFNNGKNRFDEELWAEAIAALEKALQFDPQLWQARLMLAQAGLQHGNLGLAESHLRDVLKDHPRNVAAYQLLGEIARQRGDHDEAIRSFRLALLAAGGDRQRPEVVLAHVSLATSLRTQGYLRAAADQLQAYLDTIAKPTPEMLQDRKLKEIMALYRGKAAGMIGEIRTELRAYDLAVAAYRRAVAESPEDPGLRKRFAHALARAGDAEQALAVARQWLVDFPQEANGFEFLKKTCELLGEPQRYDAELARLAKQTTDPQVGEHLANLLLERGKVAPAIALLEDITIKPNVAPDPCFLLAQLYARSGKIDKAYWLLIATLRAHPETDGRFGAFLTEVRTADPTDDQNKVGVAAFLDSAGRLVRENPDDAMARFGLGLLLALDHQNDRAIAELSSAAKLDPSFGASIGVLAKLYIATRRWQDALTLADKSIADGISRADLYLAKGMAHEALGELDEAETAFLESFRLDRKSPDALFQLGLSAERRGHLLRCEQLYRRILDDVDPRNIAAREKLVRLFMNSGKLELAREYFSDFQTLGQEGAAVERCRAMLALTTSTAPSGKARLEAYQAALREILAKFPPDAETYLDIAKSYFAVNDFESALEADEQALRLSPNDVATRELKATLLARLLEFDRAAETVRSLLIDRPRDLSYLQRLLEYAENQGDDDTAIQLVQDLMARDDLAEQRPQFTQKLLDLLRSAERFDEAVRTARQWLDEAPTDEARRRIYLLTLGRAGQHDQAIALAREFLEDDPTNRELQIQLLGQLQNAERHIEAQQLVLSWLADAADDIELNGALIRLCWSVEAWDDALDIARTGSELSENGARYNGWIGQGLLFARRFDEAVDFYRQQADAIQTEQSYQQLVNVLLLAEQYREAERVVHKVMKPHLAAREAGKRYDLRLILAMRSFLVEIFQKTGREVQAIQQLEEMHKLDPNDPMVNNNLGYTWADAGKNLDEAERMIRYALSQDPRSSANLDSLGWVLYKRGTFDKAAYYVGLAIRMANRKDAVLHDHLADALYRSGKSDQARKHWEEAAKICAPSPEPPPDREQRELLAKVQAKLKQLADGQPVTTAELGEAGQASSQPSP
jgi:tetratricopeptide (TPR) repeat protein